MAEIHLAHNRSVRVACATTARNAIPRVTGIRHTRCSCLYMRQQTDGPTLSAHKAFSNP
jgi:hypothetical protein